MTTSPVMSISEELVAELEAVAHTGKGAFMIECAEVHALLTERAELKQEVGRLNARLLLSSAHAASTVASCMAQVSGIAGAAAELQRDADRWRSVREMLSDMVELHKERGTVLTIHLDTLRECLEGMQSEAAK